MSKSKKSSFILFFCKMLLTLLLKVSCGSLPFIEDFVTHGKVSRWCLYSIQTHTVTPPTPPLTRAHRRTHRHTQSTRRKELSRLCSLCILCCSPVLPTSQCVVICIIFIPAHLWTRTTLVSPF